MEIYNRIMVILQDNERRFELYPIDINDWDESIEVYSHTRHPELKRGFVGDFIYQGCGFNVNTTQDIKSVDIDCYKDVLLKSVQCWRLDPDGAIEWKYTFLKY